MFSGDECQVNIREFSSWNWSQYVVSSVDSAALVAPLPSALPPTADQTTTPEFSIIVIGGITCHILLEGSMPLAVRAE